MPSFDNGGGGGPLVPKVMVMVDAVVMGVVVEMGSIDSYLYGFCKYVRTNPNVEIPLLDRL